MTRWTEADYAALMAKRGAGAAWCRPCASGKHRKCQRNERPPKPCACPRHEQKYHAEPTIIDGIRFASKREAMRYGGLCLEQKMGRITGLGMQRAYHLIVNGHLICRYIADFVYTRDGQEVVEDAKGARKGTAYEMFKLKAALMLACHGITVVEV